MQCNSQEYATIVTALVLLNCFHHGEITLGGDGATLALFHNLYTELNILNDGDPHINNLLRKLDANFSTL